MTAYSLLVVISILSIATTLIKRKAMLNYNLALEDFFSLGAWFSIFSNPYVLLVLAIGFIMFSLNLVVLYLISVHKLLIFSWTLVIPIFLVTMFASYKLLNEKIIIAQYPYIGILILSMVIAFIGMYGYIRVGP